MIVKVSIPNRFQFKAVPSFKTVLLQKQGEVHYIGGADILPPPLESKKRQKRSHFWELRMRKRPARF